MAKMPAKPGTKPAAPAVRKTPRKPAAPARAADTPDAPPTVVAKPVKKPAAARAPKATKPTNVAPPARPDSSAEPAAAPVAVVQPAKSVKPPKGKAKAEHKSLLKQGSARIAQLATDILADRIIPTIAEIKALAATALGQHDGKAKKPKRKKK